MLSLRNSAMVKLGTNSRVKDFFDIWLLSRQFDFAGETLALAIERTFTTRGTTITGPHCPDRGLRQGVLPTNTVAGFVRKNRLQGTPANFADIVETIAIFLALS